MAIFSRLHTYFGLPLPFFIQLRHFADIFQKANTRPFLFSPVSVGKFSQVFRHRISLYIHSIILDQNFFFMKKRNVFDSFKDTAQKKERFLITLDENHSTVSFKTYLLWLMSKEILLQKNVTRVNKVNGNKTRLEPLKLNTLWK